MAIISSSSADATQKSDKKTQKIMSSIMSRGVGVVLFHSPNSAPPSACRQLQGDGAGGWVGVLLPAVRPSHHDYNIKLGLALPKT